MAKIKNEIEKFKDDSIVIYDEAWDILIQKQLDYGPLNIANSPGGPLNGLLVRMFDKISRLNNLVYNVQDTPKNESVEDSFIDLLNYSAIALMVIRGKWPQLSDQGE
jgi:hypothetical protein